MPSEDVATQRVEVPVDQSTCPNVPEAVVESRRAPRIVRLEVVVALNEVRLVVDAVLAKSPVAVRAVAEAFPSVVWPVTLRVPLEVSDVVAVIEPAVSVPAVALVVLELPTTRLVMIADTAFKILAKKLDDVALVVEALVAKRFVAVALASVALVAVKLVVEASVE